MAQLLAKPGPRCKESHTLVPAYIQITASTMDRSSLCDLHRMLTGFLGKEKDFSFCQCKQLARPCSGCVQIKRRVRRDSAPKRYFNWLWEVRIYMPVALADKKISISTQWGQPPFPPPFSLGLQNQTTHRSELIPELGPAHHAQLPRKWRYILKYCTLKDRYQHVKNTP